jgi:hypothetical protein
MSQLAEELELGELSAQLRELAAASAQPEAGARVAAIMSGPELAADILKAREHAIIEACGAVWDVFREAPEAMQAKVRVILGRIMTAAEDAADEAAADAWLGANPDVTE